MIQKLDANKAIIYDCESYPNLFSVSYCLANDVNKNAIIEISQRKNQLKKLIVLLDKLHEKNWFMIGFNNGDYDWTILDWIYKNSDDLLCLSGLDTAKQINDFNNYWFNFLQKDKVRYFEYKKENKLWPNNFYVKQIDLFKIHRLDAARVGLKTIQFNMGFPNIRTLPFEVSRVLTSEEIDKVLDYNLYNDVLGTKLFFDKSLSQIEFRQVMGENLNKYLMLSSDVKIAEIWFQQKLEENLVECYKKTNLGRVPNQTRYPEGFFMDDSIFDCIEFKTEGFNAIKKWFSEQHIIGTKGVFTDLTSEDISYLDPYMNKDKSNLKKEGIYKKLELLYGGIPFTFGQGGLHASVISQYVNSDDDYLLLDLDVKSYYPSIIALIWKVFGEDFRVYPKHIGEIYCDIVKYVRDIRFKTDKSNPWNLMYKLILNAFTYGKLNEDNSFVFDPKAMLTVTINGQLMLCMLAEMIIENTKNTTIIQANTDGITVRVHKSEYDKVKELSEKWQDKTGLQLDEAYYDFMAINDVNNYLAKYSSDPRNEKPSSMKVKGAYLNKPTWTQDFSFLVIPKAVEAYFKDGILPEDFIVNHKEDHDFMAHIKIDKRFELLGIFKNNDNSSLSVTDALMFNRLLNHESLNVIEVLKELDNYDKFIDYIKLDIAKTKGIAIEDVDFKSINRRVKSVSSKSNFLGEELSKIFKIKEKVTKAFVKFYLENDGCIPKTQLKIKKLLPVTAYYVAKNGFFMYKETMPTEEKSDEGSFTGVEAGFEVLDCNDITTFDRNNVNFDWYINQAWKLIKPIDKLKV